ncbi:MAG: hypothetical protein IH884_06825 [Myxococcales bacterium]|nr:hypothetical protein [Myxococcales bacterium]
MGILIGTSFAFSEEHLGKLMAEGREYLAGLAAAKAEAAEDEAPDDEEDDEPYSCVGSAWLHILPPGLFPTHESVRSFVSGKVYESLSAIATCVAEEAHDGIPDKVRSSGVQVAGWISRDLAALGQVAASDSDDFDEVGESTDVRRSREDVLAFAVLAASQAWTDDIVGPALRVLLDDQAEDEGGSA